MKISDYIESECERQHTTKCAEMMSAFAMAYDATVPGIPSMKKFIQAIAYHVEPELNVWYKVRCHGRQVYSCLRRSHVGFDHGGTACPTAEVPDRFARTVSMYDVDMNSAEVDLWIKSLLQIHPFVEGNGRTFSILRNWCLGTMADPQPLPYYDF